MRLGRLTPTRLPAEANPPSVAPSRPRWAPEPGAADPQSGINPTPDVTPGL